MMKLSWLYFLVAFAVPVLLPSPTAAQGLTAEEAARRFALFDVNGDGRISKEEFELNKVTAIFDSRQERAGAKPASSGSTGAIDHRQIAISRETAGLKQEIFATMDSNGDGILSASEIISSDLMQFESIDRNGDGFIDRAEFGALIDRLFR